MQRSPAEDKTELRKILGGRSSERTGSKWDDKVLHGIPCLRLRWAVAAARIRDGWTYARIRAKYGVSDGFIRKWSRIYGAHVQLCGITKRRDTHIRTCMKSVSNRPKNVKSPVRDEIRKEVVERRTMYGFEGADRIKAACGLHVSHTTITKVLREEGFIGKPLKRHSNLTYGRYERPVVNDLWHTDYKSWICNGVTYHSIWVIDDRSRFILGYHIDTCTSAQIAIDVVAAAVERFGAPRQLLTDHGTEFYTVSKGKGRARKPSALDIWCKEHGIDHIYSRVAHPQTNGKMERTHRSALEETPCFGNLDTLDEAVKTFGRWIDYYNTKRPHGALNYDIPVNVFIKGMGVDLRMCAAL